MTNIHDISKTADQEIAAWDSSSQKVLGNTNDTGGNNGTNKVLGPQDNAKGFLDRFFKISERGSNVGTEIVGGITIFMTMAYIIVVNPAILSFAGLPVEPSTTATILTAVFGSLLMGLYANLPVAVAPYMGENAFIAFGLAAMGIGWQQRLGAVFVSGVFFLLLSILRIRPWLARSISSSMKYSFGVGIGLFLTFVGLYQTGIVTSGATGLDVRALVVPSTNLLRAPDVPLKIGNLHDPQVLLALFGFLLITALLHRQIKGAILIGIVLTAGLGICLGYGHAPTAIAALPFGGNYSLSSIAFKLDIPGVLQLSFVPILLTLFLMSFLDTLGTLVGVGAAGDMLDENGDFPEIERPMIVDSLSCMFSSVTGSSTSGAFVESATGIEAGARTGLAAVTVALLFFAALFFVPLFEPLQHLRFAYAPALMAVGLLMMKAASKVDFSDLTEAVPAFATIAMMIFSFNIANGLTAGLILYPAFKIAAGRANELKSGAYLLALMCLVYYVFGLPH
jgi:AGZA family xanthine/uracil permease-like MFS transporter